MLSRVEEVPVISDIVPGYAQQVSFSSVTVIHVHGPSGYVATAAQDSFFQRDVAEAIAGLATPPVLIGDFNCVLLVEDTAANFYNKRCPPLADLVAAFHLTDAFPHLYPQGLPAFTFRCRGAAGSRLDRAYLPMELVGPLKVAVHMQSLSDHAALYVEVGGTCCLLLSGWVQSPTGNSMCPYWGRTTFCQPLPSGGGSCWLAGRPLGACPADWWEEEAKPAFQDFCKRFARQAAHRRQETAFFLQMALQRAQVAENWTSVALLRGRLRVMAAYGFAGRAVRSRQNQGAAALDTIFQVAEEATMPRQGPLHITRGS